MLASLKDVKPDCRFYFAGSSEMFGKIRETPQNELTPFHPRSAYGISKVAAYELTRNYREAYGIYAVGGLVYNHESPRRGYEFVTRKISSGVARIKLGLSKELRLGNLDAIRDWGFAKDYVKAMWLMLQGDSPRDYVVATGKGHSVRECCQVAFAHVGLDYRDYVVVDQTFFRPAEVDLLVGDALKAKQELGWQAEVSFKELVRLMVETDLEFASAVGK